MTLTHVNAYHLVIAYLSAKYKLPKSFNFKVVTSTDISNISLFLTLAQVYDNCLVIRDLCDKYKLVIFSLKS